MVPSKRPAESSQPGSASGTRHEWMLTSPAISPASVWIARSASARAKSWVCMRASGTPPRLDETNRGVVRARGHPERAVDRRLLHHDEVAHEIGHRLEALDAREHDPAAGRDVVERLRHRLGGVRGHLDHDVGAATVRELAHAPPDVLLLDVDHVVGAELACERELRRVAREAGHDDRVGARRARRHDRRETALAGAEDQHRVAGAGRGNLDRPAKSGAERVEHDREARRDVGAHLVHDRARVEVHVVGVAAPEPGRVRQRHVAVREHRPAPAAHLIAALETRATVTARDRRLDRDTVADVDLPALRRTVADRGDHAERLVSRDHRHRDRDRAGVLLHVAAADAARLDAKDRALGVDRGNRQLAQPELARSLLHDDAARARQHVRRP